MKNFYAMLATDVNCNQAEIQAAYEKLLHDFPPSNTNNRKYRQRFSQINSAYYVLSNPESRHKYDQKFKKLNQPKHFNTKVIDVTFSIVLVFFTIVFADYVITSIQHHPLNKWHPPAVKPIAVLPKIDHKKHHHKIKTVAYHHQKSEVAKSATVAPVLPAAQIIVQKAVAVNQPVPDKIIPVKTVEKQDTSPKLPAFLYVTRLKANETGIVNMRLAGVYSSGVIKTIKTGAQVSVLERGNNYYKVKFEEAVGFVPKWTLENR